jgi:hypothetical protein
MKNGSYVDKTGFNVLILCAVFSLLFACLMCYLWVDAAKDTGSPFKEQKEGKE